MSYELLIQNSSGKVMSPAVCDEVVWSTERSGTAGKLTFKVMKDSNISFGEGNKVQFRWNGENIFLGFVFTKKRSDYDCIEVTAYDQLRYLKNKDSCVFENKTATEIIQELATKFQLTTGTMESTTYKIGSLTEDDSTLFDIIATAMDYDMTNTGKLYVLYDDFGKLALKSIESMKTTQLIDDHAAQDFSYTSSIDDDTYNQIKLTYEDSDSGKKEIYMAKDSSNIGSWGVLQYTGTVKKTENGVTKANQLLKLYNAKTRKLTIKGIKGDTSVRAGSLVPVSMNVGDLVLKNYLLVETCKHTFKNNEHTMELKLKGGGFNA